MEFDRITFPCQAEYTLDAVVWHTGYILGNFTKGSQMATNSSVLQYWGVIDKDGTYQLIYNLKYVRFNIYKR